MKVKVAKKNKKKLTYNFRVMWNNKGENPGMMVELEDGTQFVVLEKLQELIIRYPKKKFVPLIKKQMSDKKSKYVQFSYSPTEVNALLKGIDIAEKNMQMKKAGIVIDDEEPDNGR